jgi:hypothetical protein
MGGLDVDVGVSDEQGPFGGDTHTLESREKMPRVWLPYRQGVPTHYDVDVSPKTQLAENHLSEVLALVRADAYAHTGCLESVQCRESVLVDRGLFRRRQRIVFEIASCVHV